jgi:hypothetical protein
MEIQGFEVIHLELKYCERCGGLWLRMLDVPDVYCALCVVEMLELPAPRRVSTKPRLPGNHGTQLTAGPETPSLIFGKGGTA